MRIRLARLSPVVLIAASVLALSPVAVAQAGQPASNRARSFVYQAETDPITWSVKPADDANGGRTSFDYSTDPGTAIKDWVVIANSGTTGADFRVYATDAINDFDSGDLSLLPAEKKPVDVGAWITPTLADVHLEPGTQATVPFTLLIPSDASPGDHTAGIIASSTTTGEQDGQQVVLDQRVAARVYLRVSGDVAVSVEPAGFVAGFTPSWNPFAPGSLSVDYSLKNTGNIRLDVNQNFAVVGPLGIGLGAMKLDPVSNLLPGQSAHITKELPAIAALAVLWSTVDLVPGPVGSTAAPGSTPATPPAADGSAPADEGSVDPNAGVDFAPASATTVSAAISWTLLALVLFVALAVFLIVRYVRTTRERMYDAIDQAAEEARDQAAREQEQSRQHEVPTR